MGQRRDSIYGASLYGVGSRSGNIVDVEELRELVIFSLEKKLGEWEDDD